MDTKGFLKENTDIHAKEPKQYRVIMINDDFTTMDFVVSVLMDIFHMDRMKAEQTMMQVHKGGRAVVGIYPYDIAVSKTTKAMERAKAEGFPFRMQVEEA